MWLDVDRLHLGGVALVQSDDPGGVEHRVAAVEQPRHVGGVGHLAAHHLDGVVRDAERGDRLRHSARQQPHRVAGGDERGDGVRPQEAGAAGDRDAHVRR